ncbi:MAG: hypothetical protein A2836_02180 [Candidatus Taylorbacteria bacterium RIFCSPHIGHO2_01_FULL_45_63]|uniref:Transglycosylase SLT domain-containing protein n=1 Tax=Candidatus Taylorbacteria bacterium RIFCSPHIGHO2_02_FULL_45_35 TaxID=1802311 RepID=A0A1G2MUB0_9BACT|nr:MAG: hypothetical protein A2836_02180 [Candidatus Taylorbacteria bacterium RIFCSPHIGHO2_01_FULL_45_63]OHA27415.1 MAG: hypothetical protein A3D56_03945 [Candidatus Taylorbacteria bacterium RIFCSPHIGHO2_02_FULL_45_35]OHA34278.1 MAG: hypothetical protein A3A22_01335 [Candidatus Taylorbacteria bacterium RIFCSPLOWO2_01_FULL_45_34b]
MHKLILVAVVYKIQLLIILAADPGRDIRQLIPALIQVESSGRDFVIGDRSLGEKAYGPLQIRKPVVDDVNRAYGTNYRPEEMLGNRKLSIEVCEKYLRLYATPKRLGMEATPEHLARIWNGGPNGWKRNVTLPYWQKVKRLML